MNSELPHTTEPIGAPRPFDRQNVTESNGSAHVDAATPVGGLSDRADPNRFLVIRRSGEVAQGEDIPIYPGDEIIALPKVPTKNLQIATSITQILFQLALAGATVGALINSL